MACVATSEDGGEELWPPVVRGLELQGNGIGNGGFGVLQWYASKMPGMLKLDLEDNDITVSGRDTNPNSHELTPHAT